MVVKNNSFLNSYFRQKKWLEICYVKKQDLVKKYQPTYNCWGKENP